MLSGLLWFDNDPQRGLNAKVEDAVLRYREKFGAMPDTCYVNRAALKDGEMTLAVKGADAAVRVLPAENVLAHHFWVGVEDQVTVRRA